MYIESRTIGQIGFAAGGIVLAVASNGQLMIVNADNFTDINQTEGESITQLEIDAIMNQFIAFIGSENVDQEDFPQFYIINSQEELREKCSIGATACADISTGEIYIQDEKSIPHESSHQLLDRKFYTNINTFPHPGMNSHNSNTYLAIEFEVGADRGNILVDLSFINEGVASILAKSFDNFKNGREMKVGESLSYLDYMISDNELAVYVNSLTTNEILRKEIVGYYKNGDISSLLNLTGYIVGDMKDTVDPNDDRFNEILRSTKNPNLVNGLIFWNRVSQSVRRKKLNFNIRDGWYKAAQNLFVPTENGIILINQNDYLQPTMTLTDIDALESYRDPESGNFRLPELGDIDPISPRDRLLWEVLNNYRVAPSEMPALVDYINRMLIIRNATSHGSYMDWSVPINLTTNNNGELTDEWILSAIENIKDYLKPKYNIEIDLLPMPQNQLSGN